MTRYERVKLSLDGDCCDVEGRIVDVLEAPRGGRNAITALVEVPVSETTAAADSGDSGVDLYQAGSGEPVDTVPDKTTFYCQGTKANDEPCSREVDEPGERCFQHPRDDE